MMRSAALAVRAHDEEIDPPALRRHSVRGILDLGGNQQIASSSAALSGYRQMSTGRVL